MEALILCSNTTHSKSSKLSMVELGMTSGGHAPLPYARKTLIYHYTEHVSNSGVLEQMVTAKGGSCNGGQDSNRCRQIVCFLSCIYGGRSSAICFVLFSSHYPFFTFLFVPHFSSIDPPSKFFPIFFVWHILRTFKTFLQINNNNIYPWL